MGKVIKTVLGDIDPDKLGIISMYDQLIYDGARECEALRAAMPSSFINMEKLPIELDEPVTLSNVGYLRRNALLSLDAWRQTDTAELTDELKLYKRLGGESLLSESAGVMPDGLFSTGKIFLESLLNVDRADSSMEDISFEKALSSKKIAEASGVNIIETAGFLSPLLWNDMLHGLLAPEYLRIVLNSIRLSPIEPGHLTLALHRSKEDEREVLKAMVRAALETGLSISIILGRAPEKELLEIEKTVEEEGLSRERIILSNLPIYRSVVRSKAISSPSSVASDIALARRYLDKGYNISVCVPNQMSNELYGDYDIGDLMIFAGLLALVDKGYCDQKVLGGGVRGKIMLHDFGGEGYCRLLYYVIPMLRDTAALSDLAIRAMTRENAVRILSV